MKPSRELDAQVHELVFGTKAWTRFPDRCPECDAQVPDDFFHFQHHSNDYGKARFCLAGHRLLDVPRYSTDIAAAWELVLTSELGKKSQVYMSREDEGVFYFSFQNLEGCFPARAETLPLAICLAALKAVAKAKPDDTVDALRYALEPRT